MPYFMSEDGCACGYYEESQLETYHLRNYDLIKQMNVDELAAFLDSIEQGQSNNWAEWLRQPAKK